MKRLALCLVLAGMAACTKTGDDRLPSDTTVVPIGPGSDSTALIPPDTPGSRPATGTPAVPRDTTHKQRPR